MKVLAITQARIGSTRFPEKILKTINGETLLEIHLKRILKSKMITKLKVATTTERDSNKITDIAIKLGLDYYKGSVDNVLERFYRTAENENPDWIVRITSDCPLIDPVEIDKVIDYAIKNDLDYVSNTLKPTFPDGIDVSAFKFSALKKAFEEATLKSEHEHVTSYIYKNSSYVGGSIFKSGCVLNDIDYSKIRLTVDTYEDFVVIERLIKVLGTERPWIDYVKYLQDNPEVLKINEKHIRNEGYLKSLEMDKFLNGKGQILYKRAKQVIPGGTMLLSKRPEMFLPDLWPTYFSKAKGCKVWDLDGNEYIDMSIMGIGTNTLGYGHPEVDEAVMKTIIDGNMSTFNCSEEVYLAEKLIEIHPWADMARFARSGGEANTIAIRIARAASGKDKVAMCGYHGWHDWYLSANLGDDKNLDGHLLPGLEPKGVPRSLKGNTIPFHYNNYEELLEIVNLHPDLGVIIMEVTRNEGPKDGFLEKVRKLATERSIVLIFDECTSGFRETYGGIYKLFGVEPDMAMFGKTLGNGYAINAVIGKREVMEAAQTTFISSSFWTERIGPTAGLTTLKVMERIKSWEMITNTGRDIAKIWEELAKKYQLPIRVFGLPALIKFAFNSPNGLAYKTLITQEMLKKGYLAGNSVYVCIDHTEKVLKDYSQALEEVFQVIQKCENGLDVNTLLKGPKCHSEFKRLN